MGCENLSFLAQLSAPAPVSDLEILVNNPRNEEQLIRFCFHTDTFLLSYLQDMILTNMIITSLLFTLWYMTMAVRTSIESIVHIGRAPILQDRHSSIWAQLNPMSPIWKVSIIEGLGAHEDAPSIGKVGMGMTIGRVVGMLRLAMSCSRLFNYKFTCSQLAGTCFSLGGRNCVFGCYKDLSLKLNLIFLRSPACSELGHRYKTRQGLLAFPKNVRFVWKGPACPGSNKKWDIHLLPCEGLYLSSGLSHSPLGLLLPPPPLLDPLPHLSIADISHYRHYRW